MLNKSNFKEWFDRYKYAELAATTAALNSSQFRHFFDELTTAYLITFAEYFAFYGVILFLSYRKLVESHKGAQKRASLKEKIELIKKLILEFGYPAILDLLFIRPFFMYWMPIWTGNQFIGIIVGKISADSFFYTCSIINYELLKRKR